MTSLTKSLLLALSLTLPVGNAAFAQTAPADAGGSAPAAGEAAPGSGLSMGSATQAPDGPGTTYVEATFDSWEKRCIRTVDGSNPCQLYQLLKDDQGGPVAEFSMFAMPPGQQAAAGATIVVPLQTLLAPGITIAIDTNPARRYPMTFCAPPGCVARVGFTQAEVDAMKNGKSASLTIVPAMAPDQKITLNVSLKGFTAGFEEMKKSVPQQ
ncbi:invasion associated locus B family protein [Tabrizicola sp. J26]|uniref:invasion associated locus B family protein n=1 Tax=Alitabrizicola rongguiensis TaxID=2909234 RepID=UPI001F37FEA6|nr:invasion associated locus B family protein [Tabrizicola rongguiensis]MCF1710101.1 invasion associated locus B family protein [Tabrizicola rongguiensis]